MKKLLYIIPLLFGMALTSCYDEDIEKINNRLDEIENSSIASLQQQIDAINASLPELENMDKELNDYITTLQTTATNLQNSINETNTKIDEVEETFKKAIADAQTANDALKSGLLEQLNTAKADVLAQLAATKSELEGELAQINATIEALKQKDTELDQKIANLKEYVNTEISATENWVNATFATIAQYNAIAADIATIKENLLALNSSIAELENSISNKVAEELANAIEPIKEQISNSIISDITAAYNKAVSDAKSEITAAYTSLISKAINALETSMKNGMITAGSATLKYEIRPASVAEELVDVWEDALSVKAVYTQTRAMAGNFVSLTIESVSAKDGILTVVVAGEALGDEYFRNELSANVRLEISNGYNCLTSDYVNMVPWTTDTVYIPDANFKAYLVGEFDTNSDNEISLEEAENIKKINISASLLQVKSMAGVEYFTNLEKLDCSYNRITSLDLAGNTKLTEVNVSNNKLTSLALPASVVEVDASINQLTTLDVSHATDLTLLNVSGNKLASLNVSQNKSLTVLHANNNQLVTLDVTKLLLLEELSCGGNNLSTLNLTKNAVLTALDCHGNTLTTLDLTKNIALVALDCGENSLTAIYLGTNKLESLDCAYNALTGINVATQTKLGTLDCSHNALIQLDVTKCAKLTSLNCSFNSLQSLNVSNNSALTTLNCSNNAELGKVWVKDEAQQGTVAIDKDDTTTIYFNNGGLHIPDAALKAYLVANYDDDGDGEISITESDNITMVNCSGKGVSDLTGLESCTNLVTLNCSNNNITNIELPNLAKFTTLTCYGNPISKINLNNCAALNKFNIIDASTNAVRGEEIWIDGYAGATTMDITIVGTPFTTFTFVNATALTGIKFYGDFTTVNLYGNSALEDVDVNPILDLQKLDIHSCKLQTLNVTEKSKLTYLDASANELTEINVTQNNHLEHLNLADNGLSVINVRNNMALTYFNINNNSAINTVNVTKNTALTELYVNSLAITELNVSNNTLLTKLECHTNPSLTTLICANDFDFNKTHISIDKGLGVLDINGNVLTPSIGDWITVNFQTGIVFTTSNTSIKMVSLSETTAIWNTAKTWCSNYNYGTGWYLPTLEELKIIYQNKSTINSTLSANGYTTLCNNYYWSSDWTSTTGAYSLLFSSGVSEYNNRDTPCRVRAIIKISNWQ